MAKKNPNIPEPKQVDTWMGRHRAKLGLSQKGMAELITKVTGKLVSREQYRSIESVREPNTWCARLLDLYLTEKGVALLKRKAEEAQTRVEGRRKL